MRKCSKNWVNKLLNLVNGATKMRMRIGKKMGEAMIETFEHGHREADDNWNKMELDVKVRHKSNFNSLSI